MSQRRVILAFGTLTAIFATGYGVMFTMLDDFRDDYGIANSSAAMIVAVGFFAAFVTQILFAPLADRGHARKLVFIGLVFNIIGLLGMAIGKDIGMLLAGRLVMGVGAGMAVPAIRRIVIIADPDNLGRNIGRLLAADVTGFAIGPAISALLVGPFGIPAPFLVVAAATAACVPLIIRIHIDEVPADQQTEARFAFDLLRNRSYVGALCFGAAVFLMVGTFDSLWVLVLDDLNTADWIANLGITLFALPLIVLGPIGGKLAQRLGPFRVGAVGLLIGAAFMFSYGFWASGITMFAVSMFHALSDGATVASSGVAAALVVPEERQAGAQGLLGGTQTLVGGIAALVAGELYEHHGRTIAYTTCAIAMVALVFIGLACVGRSWSARPTSDSIVAGKAELDSIVMT